jgi:trigger factor
MRQSFAQLHPITDRSTVERGDVVTLDYEGHVDGKLAGRREGRLVEVGASGFPPEFDDYLVGAAVGVEQTFDVTYPVEPRVGELSGKAVRFRVTVRALAHKDVPVLDDEFAKDHGDCATLEELRARVRGKLEADAAAHADEVARRAALQKLAEVHDIPIPQAMVERRTEGLMREVRREWEQQRVRPKNEAEALARLREDLTPRAREQVKVALLLEAIAHQESLRVDDADLDERITAMATAAGQAAERVRALYQDPEARQDLRAQLLQARALDAVLRQARVTTVSAENSVAAPE